MSEQTNTISDAELESRKERYFSINLRGLWELDKKLCYDIWVDGYQWLARQVEKLSTATLTGFLTFPLMIGGIAGRNAARVAFESSKDRWYLGPISGALSVVGTVWFGLPFFFEKLVGLSPLMTGWIGQGAAGLGAAVATAFVSVPAYTAGLLAGSTALALAAGTVSVLFGLANADIALKRSYDRFRGIKYSAEAVKKLERDFTRNSLEERHEGSKLRAAHYAVEALSTESKQKIYKNLKDEFEPAANGQEAANGDSVSPESKAVVVNRSGIKPV